MTVKNYNKGNYVGAFDCIIYGHIEMSANEWAKARAYLVRSGGDLFTKRMLRNDLDRNDKNITAWKPSKYTYRNVRVTYTQKLFKHFNLPRYKTQNYMLKIAKS